MRLAACGGTRKAIGRKLTNRHSRTKAQQALGSVLICIAKKVIPQMPRTGISEQARLRRKVRSRRNGTKLLARCSNPRELSAAENSLYGISTIFPNMALFSKYS